MDKNSSQSNSRNKPRRDDLAKVTAIPRANRPDSGREPEASEAASVNDQALQKDLELLARMREQIDHLPDIDAARIVQLHERIRRGEYQVDSDRLAGKLRQFESDFPDPGN